MNENKTRKGGLNIVDVLLILLVLGGIGVVGYLLTGGGGDKGDYDLLYTVEIPIIRNDVADQVMKYQPGDTVIDSVKAYNIGKLVSIVREEAYQATANLETGIMSTEKYTDHSKLIITIQASAQKTDDMYYINGYKIGVGLQVHFRMPTFISYGYCTSITPTPAHGGSAAEQAGQAANG